MAYLLTAIGVNLCMTFLMRYSEHHDGNRYALNIWNYITGTPYVYGGTTAGVGFDCSGLVQYCHAVAGISLP